MRVELDCRKMTDRKAAHAYLKQALALPDYYGNNLDALWDILTAWGNPLTIVIENCGESLAQLGSHGETVMQLFQEAEEENNNLSVDFRL